MVLSKMGALNQGGGAETLFVDTINNCDKSAITPAHFCP